MPVTGWLPVPPPSQTYPRRIPSGTEIICSLKSPRTFSFIFCYTSSHRLLYLPMHFPSIDKKDVIIQSLMITSLFLAILLAYKVFTQASISASDTPFIIFPVTISAFSDTHGFRSFSEFSNPLPPDVANRTIFLPEKS